MKTANLIAAGLATHPQSEKQRMRVTVDMPYTAGGERGRWTDIWLENDAIEPSGQTPIKWGHRHAEYDGGMWRKVEHDSNHDAPLH